MGRQNPGMRLTIGSTLPHTGVPIAGLMLRPTHVPSLRDSYRRAGLWRRETVAEAFEATAARAPDRIALVDGSTRVGFAELVHRARRIAGGLAELRVAAGDAVAVQLPDRHQ